MLASGYYKPEQLVVIYNSLNYKDIESMRAVITEKHILKCRERLFGTNPRFVIVAIGRINNAKRIDLLLKALALIDNKNNLFRCLIIGDGPELKSLKSLAAKLELTRFSVAFYGPAYDKVAEELLLASDLCVIPGNIGLSAMHAMSAGLPVISTTTLIFRCLSMRRSYLEKQVIFLNMNLC